MSGHTVRYAKLQNTNRASYVLVNPLTGAIAADLNGCDAPADGVPCQILRSDRAPSLNTFIYWEQTNTKNDSVIIGVTGTENGTSAEALGWNVRSVGSGNLPPSHLTSPSKDGTGSTFSAYADAGCIGGTDGMLRFTRACSDPHSPGDM